jgi:hypothetical protein
MHRGHRIFAVDMPARVGYHRGSTDGSLMTDLLMDASTERKARVRANNARYKLGRLYHDGLYKIELCIRPRISEMLCGMLCGHNEKWERSWTFSGEYTLNEAKRLIAQDGYERFKFRIVPARKQYRRHAAVSQLELRGAKAMLRSALKYLVTDRSTATWTILMDALDAVTCQLETL